MEVSQHSAQPGQVSTAVSAGPAKGRRRWQTRVQEANLQRGYFETLRDLLRFIAAAVGCAGQCRKLPYHDGVHGSSDRDIYTMLPLRHPLARLCSVLRFSYVTLPTSDGTLPVCGPSSGCARRYADCAFGRQPSRSDSKPRANVLKLFDSANMLKKASLPQDFNSDCKPSSPDLSESLPNVVAEVFRSEASSLRALVLYRPCANAGRFDWRVLGPAGRAEWLELPRPILPRPGKNHRWTMNW